MDAPLAHALLELRRDQATLRSDNAVSMVQNDAFLGAVISAMDIVEASEGIIVKRLTNKSSSFNFREGMTVDALKQEIECCDAVSHDEQRLIFKGQQLEDGRQLSEYGIGPGCVLHLVLRLKGGCFVAGTPITMADGTKRNIEDIKVGDQVYSCQVMNGSYKHCVQTVFQTFVLPKAAVPLVKLVIEGRAVICTVNHPFLVPGQGWSAYDPTVTPACEGNAVALLQKGLQVYGEDGI